MRIHLFFAALVALPATAIAGGADGVWQTAKEKDGSYLEVTVGPCSGDASETCGTISRAFTAAGEDPSYANLGKPIIKGMTESGSDAYSGGTVWDPVHDKTYTAKMTLDGSVLDVEGCISIICRGEHWTRVN